MLLTVVVFWLAHAFAGWLGAAFHTRQPASRAEVVRELVTSSPLALSAVPLVAPMVLARTGLWGTDTGLWISFGLTVAVFLLAGLVIAVRRRQGPWAGARFVVIAVALGLALTTLKEVLH